MQQRDVGLVHGAGAKLIGQRAMRGIVARDNQRPGRAAIEPVHDARTQRAARVGKRAQTMQQRVDQRAVRDSRARVHDHARGLLTTTKSSSSWSNSSGISSGCGFERRARQHFDVDHLARGHALGAPGQPFADTHSALIDQFLDAGAAQFGQAGSEIKIEAAPGIFGGSDEAARREGICRGHGLPG